MKITANREMQAISHNCNWPDQVVSEERGIVIIILIV